jgi:hypothetical protein
MQTFAFSRGGGRLLGGLLAVALAAPARAYAPPPSIMAGGATTIMQGGSVTLVARPNLALAFDGTNDYVSTTLNASPAALPSTTWEAWVYPTRLNYGVRQTMLTVDDGNYDRTVMIEAGSSSFGIFTGYGVWQPVAAELNTWQHIAVVYTPTGITFYKNGVRYDYAGSYNPSSPTVRTFMMGRNPDFNERFQGQLDEVRVWSTVRTPAEILAGMNEVPAATATGLLAAWRFNEGSGSTVESLTGSYPGAGVGTDYVTPGRSSMLPATYAWSPAAGLDATAGSSVIASPLSTTTYTVTVTDANGTPASAAQTVTVTPYPDLVISSPADITGGPYNNITIETGGAATLRSSVQAYGAVRVRSGGALADGCYRLNGPASFELAAGATLSICSEAGIDGFLYTTGTRSLSAQANYRYYGNRPNQVTGAGLPAVVRDLTTENPNGVTLSAPLSVARVLRAERGFHLNGQSLTLLSTDSSTAMVVNGPAGMVNGNTVTVQRWLDGSLNPGLGYRHLTPPMFSSTVSSLANTSFRPTLNPDYNSAAQPGLVTPFPTVFGYDQRRLSLVSSNLSAFDKGWYSPDNETSPLYMLHGYTVHIGGSQRVAFTGQLVTGTVYTGFQRNADATAPDAGWHLIGNPYAAPLDWSRIDAADRVGLDAAIYVFESTGPYAGSYRAYVNGIGGNSVLPVAQAFFVRVSAGQTTSQLILRESHRLTAPDATPVRRSAADPRPLLQLDLHGAGQHDTFVAYAEAQASPWFDGQFDATKLFNPSGLNLGSRAGGEQLAIDGRPAFDAGTVLPLTVGVPAAGTYTFTLAELRHLPAGLTAYLHDAYTGQRLPLAAGSSYAFSVTAAQAAAPLTGRFELRFNTTALAARPALTAAQLSVYPNPARGPFTVSLPETAGTTALQAELFNSLGQRVLTQTAAGHKLILRPEALPAGVYTLRLHAGATVLTKRVVLQ